MKYQLSLIFISIFSTSVIFSQEASSPPKQVSLGDIELVTASLPGGTGKEWIKVICPFTSTPTWADGMLFSYSLLLEKGKDKRVLTGLIRYANIPKGLGKAIMYLSPSTMLRFGSPKDVKVSVYFDDEMVDSTSLKKGDDHWEKEYNHYDGLLLPVTSTPWVVTDYDLAADIVVGR